jgi:hypothetical protein
MKKLLVFLSILALALTAARAQTITVLMNGQQTNSIIYQGGATNVVLNRISGTASFLTSLTNLAGIVTNITPVIKGTTVGVVVGAHNITPATNTYYFNASYDRTKWDALTNVQLVVASGTLTRANHSIYVGDYIYFQVANITNGNAVAMNSNYLAIVQKP